RGRRHGGLAGRHSSGLLATGRHLRVILGRVHVVRIGRPGRVAAPTGDGRVVVRHAPRPVHDAGRVVVPCLAWGRTHRLPGVLAAIGVLTSTEGQAEPAQADPT